MREIEYRTYSREVRLDESDGVRRLSGYAVVWNQPSQDLGGFTETVRPGAFGDLTGKDIRAFFNHDYNYLLGRTTSNTLTLEQDDKGLAFSIELAQTAKAEEVYQLVHRGDLDGVSFGAYVQDEKWSEDGKTNELISLELIEISPVVFPAYLQPNVSARSLDHLKCRPKPRCKRLDRARAILALDDE